MGGCLKRAKFHLLRPEIRCTELIIFRQKTDDLKTNFQEVERLPFFHSARLKKLLICLLFPTLLVAQQNVSFSDWSTWAEKCSEHYRNPDSLLFYGRRLIKHPKAEAQIEGLFALGYRLEQQIKIDSAIYCYNKAEQLRKSHGLSDADLIYRLGMRRSQAHGRNNQIDSSLAIVNELLESGLFEEPSKLWARLMKSRGVAQRILGNYTQSIEALTTSLVVLKERESPEAINSMVNIALCYLKLGQDSIGKFWFHQCRARAWSFQDLPTKCRSMNNLGNFFLDHDDADSAGYYFRWLLRQKKGMNREGLIILFQNMAKLLSKSNEGAGAVLYLDSALALVDTSAQAIRVVELLQVQSRYKSDLGDHEQAIHLINRALAKNKLSKAVDRQITLLKIKSDILERSGKLDASIAVMKRKEKLSDSLFQVRSAAEIQEVVEGFKQAERSAQSTDKLESQRKEMGIILFVLFVLLSVLWYVRRARRKGVQSAEKNVDDQILETRHQVHTTGREELKFLRFNGGIVLPMDSFLFAVKESHHTVIYSVESGKKRTRMSMKSIMELAPEHLVQVHRSYLIRWTSVRSATFNSLTLENGHIVPFGRAYRQRLKDLDHPMWALIS